MKIQINVKEEHIIKGECQNKAYCAIALAVGDLFPNVRVNMQQIKFLNDKDEVVLNTDHGQWKFVEAFDSLRMEVHDIQGARRLEYVSPFSFKIFIPDQFLDKVFPNTHLSQVEQLINESLNCELVS